MGKGRHAQLFAKEKTVLEVRSYFFCMILFSLFERNLSVNPVLGKIAKDFSLLWDH